jgi:hypothetical protein
LAHIVEPYRRFSLSPGALQTDDAGNLHLAYGRSHLFYAVYNGSAWQRTVVDDAPGVGYGAGLHLDEKGHPHISYIDDESDSLRYAHWDGAEWHIDVAGGPASRSSTTMTLDDAGHPHIAYVDGDDYNLAHAYWDGSQWHKETVEESRVVRESGGIVTAADGTLYVSYYTRSDDVYYLARREADGTWRREAMDTSDDVDYYGCGCLVLDSTGSPHAVYQYIPAGEWFEELHHAYLQAGEWVTETIPMGGDRVISLTLAAAFDSEDDLHVAYHNFWDGGPPFAYLHQESGVWQAEESVVDQESSGVLLAVGTGEPRIVYEDDSGSSSPDANRLRYTQRTGEGWTEPETVDREFTPGGFGPDLELDRGGDAHISYQDAFHDNLSYAYQDDGVWFRTVYANGRTTGFYSALEVMDDGVVWLAYHDADYEEGSVGAIEVQPDGTYDRQYVWHRSVQPGGRYISADSRGTDETLRLTFFSELYSRIDELRFSTYDGSAWDIASRIDRCTEQAKYTTVAVDSSGYAHAAYYYADSGDLLFIGQIAGVEWQDPKVLDSEGNVGGYPSMTVDSNDDLHVVYEANGTTIKYLRQADGVWQSPEVIHTGTRPAIVTGDDDAPHVTFADGGKLWYAYRAAGGWEVQKIYHKGGRSDIEWFGGYPRVALLTKDDDLAYLVATDPIPPTANFEADPTSGESPLEVQFTNTSTGTYAECHWRFGDGITGTMENPTHTYRAKGQYTVTLTVSGAAGEDTQAKGALIQVTGGTNRIYLPLVRRGTP